MHCEQCGKRVGKTAKFCTGCDRIFFASTDKQGTEDIPKPASHIEPAKPESFLDTWRQAKEEFKRYSRKEKERREEFKRDFKKLNPSGDGMFAQGSILENINPRLHPVRFLLVVLLVCSLVWQITSQCGPENESQCLWVDTPWLPDLYKFWE